MSNTAFSNRVAFAQAAAITSATPNILVANNKVQCPTAAFTKIQDGVNAAKPGDVIRVCAGVYHEQIVIDKDVVIQADNGVVVRPVGMVANATGPSGDSIAAIIVAENATNIQLQGLIVDGASDEIMECSPRLVGILYQDASGIVFNNAVRHMRLSSHLDGCQSGNAIEVESTFSGQASVTITDNTVDYYQKNGITANESGTRVSINENSVTGVGPAVGAAQNGIQIGFGAPGQITSNTIANNIYSPCMSTTTCPANAAGILIYQSDGIHMEHNIVGANQVGIFVAANNAVVGSSTIFHSIVLDGIALVGNGNSATGNDITNSDDAGVYVQGNNQFFATLVTVVDPAPTRNFTPSPSH